MSNTPNTAKTNTTPERTADAQAAPGARPLPALMTEEQTAAYLDVRPSTLATWRSKRAGPAFVRFNQTHGVRYLVSDVERFILDKRTDGANGTPGLAQDACPE